MKQVLQDVRSGRVTLEEVPAPPVRPGGVLVRTAASAVSVGTERTLHEFAARSLLGKARQRPDLVRQLWDKAWTDGIGSASAAVSSRLAQPLPLGYSSAGIVVAAGAGAEALPVGTRVACAGAGYAVHAEVVWVPRTLCVPIPPRGDGGELPVEEAAFATLGAIALHGVRLASPTLGDRVVVIGLGVIGQLAAQLFRAHGCAVLGLDPDPVRVATARGLGVEVAIAAPEPPLGAIQEFTRGQGADAVLIAAATDSNGPVELAGEISRRKGRVVVVGAVRMDVPRRTYYGRELSLTVSCSSGPGRYDPQYEEAGVDYPVAHVRWTEQRNLQAFLDTLAADRVQVAPLITHRFPLAEAARAYALLGPDAADRPLGIVLTYPSWAPTPAARTVSVGRRASRRPAVEVVGVAALGAGAFARSTLFPALCRLEPVRLRTVVAATGASAVTAARRFGFEQASTDVRAVIEDPDVRAVFVLTPHAVHAELAAAALAAGRHVYVEKPLCVTEAELHRLVTVYRAVRPDGTAPLLTVGFNRRFSPLAARIRAEAAGAGPLAMVYRVKVAGSVRSHWSASPEQGGPLVGEACHFVDLALFLTGARPIRVFAAGLAGADRSPTLLVELSDGSVLTLVYVTSDARRMPKERLEVFAGGRSWVLEDWRRLVSFEASRVRRVRRWRRAKGHAEAVAAFVGAVRTGGPEPIPFDDIVATTQATFAAVESLRRRAPVDVPTG